MTRSVSAAFALASVVLAIGVGCSKDEKKAEPPSPDTTVAAQGAPGAQGVQVQANGTQVKVGANGTTVQVPAAGGNVQVKPATGIAPNAPVVMQQGQNTIKVQGTGADKITEMKAEDGRKVTAQGGTVTAEDPNRPGAKVQIQGDKVVIPGVGTVQAPPH